MVPLQNLNLVPGDLLCTDFDFTSIFPMTPTPRVSVTYLLTWHWTLDTAATQLFLSLDSCWRLV